MDIRISPGKLAGTLRALPSKSEAHRALILAALADKPTTILLGDGAAALSDDILRTAEALGSLGCSGEESENLDSCSLTVTPPTKFKESAVLDCGESGSTLRFLIPVCAALGGEFRFVRRGRLPVRPIATLTNALAANGVSFSEDGDDLLMSGKLTPGTFTVPGGESSQYITGILLALPLVGGTLRVTGALESAPYVLITLDMMKRFGVSADRRDEGGSIVFTVGKKRPVSPGEIEIGGDWSGAANFLAAGARVLGLDPESKQGDRAICEILTAFGASLSLDDGARAEIAELRGVSGLDMRDTPDLVPLVAVLCAAARGDSVLTGVRRLRLKESDRIASTLALLRSLGAEADAAEDALFIRGGRLRGGEVDSFADHRIAMAASVASTLADGEIVVRGAECVAKSYPGFWDTFCALGGKFTEI